MGIGMVALAFAAVYRSASSSRDEPVPPPATSNVDKSGLPIPASVGPTASADYSAPAVAAVPRRP